MGVGVVPATEFLKQSGFQLEKDGGIKVDQYLEVQGKDNIYAVGGLGCSLYRSPHRPLIQAILLGTHSKRRERVVG
jgi:NADH dehydrogenase FAD-containing subunit